jgi:SulP family sulfate permease
LLDLAKTCQKNKVRLVVCGLMHQPLDIAQRSGLTKLLAQNDQESPASVEANLPLTLADGLQAAVKTSLPSL